MLPDPAVREKVLGRLRFSVAQFRASVMRPEEQSLIGVRHAS